LAAKKLNHTEAIVYYEIERYTDLTPADLADLQKIAKGTGARIHILKQREFQRSGMIEPIPTEGLFGATATGLMQLTSYGQEILQRAQQLKSGELTLSQALPDEMLRRLSLVTPVLISNRIKKHLSVNLGSAGVKLLLQLAGSPHAYRWICRIYGGFTLNEPKFAGLISGEEKRGSLWAITGAGIDLLQQAAPLLSQS
jgi:hypothetical protein